MLHRLRRRAQSDVRLNLTAMLDMAFQLLAFFVLTFNPGPPEIKWDIGIPPTTQAGKSGTPTEPGESFKLQPPGGVDSLVVSVHSGKNGEIGTMSVGEVPIATLAGLDARLQQILGDRNQPFEQVVVQIGSELRADALSQVINVCANQRLPKKLSAKDPATRDRGRVSFVELPEAAHPTQ